MSHQRAGMALDVHGFAVEKGSGAIISGFWMKDIPPEWNRITEFPHLSLRELDSPAGRVWALADPEGWLEARYGDWRTPDQEFDSVVCARNMRGFSLLTQCYALHRIYTNWQLGNLPRALKLVRSTLAQMPGDEQLCQLEQLFSRYL